MKAKLIGAILLTFLYVGSVFATAQSPDYVIYNGKEYAMQTNPMDDYFAKYPDKKPKSNIISSANWRGYIATFEIVENVLYLKDIEMTVEKVSAEKFPGYEQRSFLNSVVPAGEKLKIDWFSGLLVLPHGKVVNYVHMGYGSTYENYILIEIDKGNFVKSKEFDYKAYTKFKERQFEAFKKTKEYKKEVEDMKKDGDRDQKSIDSFLKEFVVNYTTKIID